MVAPTTGAPSPHLVQQRSPSVVVPLIDNARPWGLPYPRLRRVLTAFRPDVVHLVNPVLLGAVAARQLGGRFPLVASLHTDVAAYTSGYGLQWLRPALHRLTSRAFSQADAALATSATGGTSARRAGDRRRRYLASGGGQDLPRSEAIHDLRRSRPPTRPAATACPLRGPPGSGERM